MADKGIIFSAPMVRALLAGRKTQTRRLVTKQSALDALATFKPAFLMLPGNADLLSYAAGDRLYVRESWRVSPEAAEGWDPEKLHGFIDYHAHGSEQRIAPSFEAVESAAFLKGDDRDWDCLPTRYRPCIHMPRWTSRLWLAVTDVRVQRLQDCTEADAEAEGCVWASADGYDIWYVPGARLSRDGATARECYSILWDSLHLEPTERWAANPWIVAVSFDVNRGNIDQVQA